MSIGKRGIGEFLFGLALCNYVAVPLHAAQSHLLAWDVSAGGNDANGCAFQQGASGTDRSLSTTPYVGLGRSGATNNNAGTSITGATVTFTSGYTPSGSDIGNVVKFSSGANINTKQAFEIIGAGAATWILDSSPVSSGTTTNAVGYMGGSCATLQAAIAASTVVDQRYFLRYSLTPYVLNSPVVVSANHGSPILGQTAIVGYHSVHDDLPSGANRPTLLVNNGTDGIDLGPYDWGLTVRDLIVDCNGAIRGVTGINAYSPPAITVAVSVINVEAKNCSQYGIATAGHQRGVQLLNSQIHDNCQSGSSYAGYLLSDYSVDMAGNTIYNNHCDGAIVVNGPHGAFEGFVDHNVIYNNTGNCLTQLGAELIAVENVFNGCGGDGIHTYANIGSWQTVLMNNLIMNNTGYGLNGANGWAFYGLVELQLLHPNIYWNNTAGNARNIVLGLGDVQLGLAQDGYSEDGRARSFFSLNAKDEAAKWLRNAGLPGFGAALE